MERLDDILYNAVNLIKKELIEERYILPKFNEPNTNTGKSFYSYIIIDKVLKLTREKIIRTPDFLKHMSSYEKLNRKMVKNILPYIIGKSVFFSSKYNIDPRIGSITHHIRRYVIPILNSKEKIYNRIGKYPLLIAVPLQNGKLLVLSPLEIIIGYITIHEKGFPKETWPVLKRTKLPVSEYRYKRIPKLTECNKYAEATIKSVLNRRSFEVSSSSNLTNNMYNLKKIRNPFNKSEYRYMMLLDRYITIALLSLYISFEMKEHAMIPVPSIKLINAARNVLYGYLIYHNKLDEFKSCNTFSEKPIKLPYMHMWLAIEATNLYLEEKGEKAWFPLW